MTDPKIPIESVLLRGVAAKNDTKPERIQGFDRPLFLEAEFLHERAVSALVVLLQVFQMLAAIRNETQKAAAGVLVLVVFAQMSGKLLDSSCQNSDLHLRRTRVGVVALRLADLICLLSLRKHVRRISY